MIIIAMVGHSYHLVEFGTRAVVPPKTEIF
jgi:hypothetical protein